MTDRIRELLTSVELFAEMNDEEIDDLTVLAQIKKLNPDIEVVDELHRLPPVARRRR